MSIRNHRVTGFVDWLASASVATCFFGFSLVACPRLCAQENLEEETFFETHVRPLLVEKCVQCHGPDEQSGLLRLDQRPDQNRTDGSGPIWKPGNPEASLLLRAIGYQDSSLQMPPDKPLTAGEAEVLTQWVQRGVFWPEDDEPKPDSQNALKPHEQIDELRQTHWAYRPVATVQPPEVQAAHWPQQPIDRFVLAKLEEAGLSPNPAADRRTLMLRAYFTLIGLPPTYEEVLQFECDPSPEAFPRLVDRLLESPHYGERWARHWLDLARYAETTGYLAGSVDTTYPYAYTYRDYVIDSLNNDKPFDRFIMEQIAADQLNLAEEEQEALAALGFLTVGRKFMNRVHDIIDDRIDVVTRGFLAQSVACARCHDHKYDPIPTADYYGLYGVFASSHEPAELPVLGQPEQSPLYAEFLAARDEKQREVDAWLEKKRQATEDELRSRVADYLVHLAQTLPNANAGEVQQKGRRGVLRPPAIQRWRQYLDGYSQQPHFLWSLWHHWATLGPTDFAQRTSQLLAAKPEESVLSQLPADLLAQLRAKPPTTMVEAAEFIGGYLESVYAQFKQQPSNTAADSAASTVPQGELVTKAHELELLLAADAPTTLDTAQILRHLNQAESNEYNQQLSKIKAVEAKHPGAPGKAMVLVDNAQPHEPVVFLRGQPGNRGPQVPRRFLQVLAHVDGGQPFQQGSGRLELARAIASPDNPLTSRVIVNRIWQQHFGFGLVRTASDFGTRGELPTHPELLDYLASEFVADGWSIKRLHRRIMLSAAWQQSSIIREDGMRLDPENRLLWRNPRRRLEFEPMRDRVLAVSGQLDQTVGGRSVAIHQDGKRRGLYAYVDREDVPSLLASFDVPSPDASQAIRPRTTVPQQALYLLNSQFILDQAQKLVQASLDSTLEEAQQSESEDASNARRIVALYRRSLARDPSHHELWLAKEFIRRSQSSDSGALELSIDPDSAEDQSDRIPSVWRYGFGSYDPETDKVLFTSMPHFNGKRWQASIEFPDASHGHLMLASDGGHPGVNLQQSVILRWISPGDGRVVVRGEFKHLQDQGDGVRARVVSSRLGLLGTWEVLQSTQSLVVNRFEVQAGDTIDFVVDCKDSSDHDSFRWTPVIRATRSPDGNLLRGTAWDATQEFQAASSQQAPAPRVDPWLQLAQVLLASNEFMFVD